MRSVRNGLGALSSRLAMGLILLAVALSPQPASAAKNVILMITDGCGENTWLATSMYQGKVGKQACDQSGWLRLSCCTYPLNLSHSPTGDEKQDVSLVYDPVKAWDASRDKKKPERFSGYVYLTTTATDSAAAATALSTGRKTYNSAINWSNDNRPMRGQTVAEIAGTQGKSVGVVTSVPWSHATPAGLGGAHNPSRNHYSEIAKEMLAADWLDVIMGGGNPDFDDNGRPLAATKKHDYQYVGGQETWRALKSGKRPWRLIESKADFEALVAGPTPPKVLGTAQVARTLQENRGPAPSSSSQPEPFAVPLNRNVPSLAVMAKGALNCLDDNPKGFFLMIEGGAVDWANHANRGERMIEEQIDFLKAVEAVVAWVESHGGWNDTLVILTADHESGLLWGPDSAKVAYQPVEDRGAGKMPGIGYNTHGHSNSLSPLFARGPGSQRFAALVKGKDATAVARWGHSGQYVNNTDIAAVMRAEVKEEKGK